MKWKCSQCSREHETEEDIKFVVCKGCLSSMEKEKKNLAKSKFMEQGK